MFVDYGQKTVARERKASQFAAKHYNATWIEFPLKNLPAITKTSLIHSTGSTEVQGRNAILISLATAYAQTIGAKLVCIGLQMQDVDYGDAQPPFVRYLRKALKHAYNVTLVAPLLYKSKEEIGRLAAHLGVPLEVTYSCYYNPSNPCGTCPSCIARKNAELTYFSEKKKKKI